MNNFTHTGAYQTASNFNVTDGIIEPSFDEELIKDTIKSNFELMKTFSLFTLEILGFKKGFITQDEINKLLLKNI